MDSKIFKFTLICLTILAIAFFFKKIMGPKASESKSDIPEVGEQVLSKEFLDFYEKFHSDSTFQMDHIVFPLDGISVNDSSENVVHKWKKEEWVIHRPIDEMGGTFTREYQLLGSMIFETISAKGYGFNMIRRFAVIDGEYHLIYYKSMGPQMVQIN